MNQEIKNHYQNILNSIKRRRTLQNERVITSPQSAHIKAAGKEVLNMLRQIIIWDLRIIKKLSKAAQLQL